MKKVVLSVVAALAMTAAAPAFAADMPVKAKPIAPAAAASPWDVLFGAAFTTDYVLRGVSQSNRKPAVQGYFEVDYTATDWLKLYAGVWGSSLYSGFADAEFDISGGARFSWGNFGLDVGYVQYEYPDGVATSGSGSYGEFYAKPSYKVADWLTIGGVIDGGDNFNDKVNVVGKTSAYYYSGNAVITLPWHPITDVTISLNPEIGRRGVRLHDRQRRCLHRLHLLGCRPRLQLEGDHARPALLGHRCPEHDAAIRFGRPGWRQGLGEACLRRHAQVRHLDLGSQISQLLPLWLERAAALKRAAAFFCRTI